MKKIYLLLLTLFTITWNLASANSNTPVPKALEELKKQGITLVSSFPVSAHLNGWVISYGDQDLIVYVTADGEHLINGVLLDAEGQDLTQNHQQQYLPSPSWDDLASSNFITEPAKANSTTKPIYVFFDPNCPFCRLAWQAVQAYRAVGLEVRWIPVAYLKPSSRELALSLLQESNATKQQKLLQDLMQQEDPKVTGIASDDPTNLAKLEANMRLMHAFRINGTPGWAWQDEQGKIHTRTGMVKLGELPAITNLPAQKHPERELMRFR